MICQRSRKERFIMPKKGYQPPKVYGKDNPNYTGPEQASKMDDEKLSDIVNVRYNLSDYDDFDDYAGNAVGDIIDTVENDINSTFPEEIQQHITMSDSTITDGRKVSVGDFLEQYDDELLSADTVSNYDSVSTYRAMDEAEFHIDMNTDDEAANDANAESIRRTQLYDEKRSEEWNEQQGRLPEDVVLDGDGNLNIPTVYALNSKNTWEYNGETHDALNDKQRANLKHLIDNVGVIHNGNGLIAGHG